MLMTLLSICDESDISSARSSDAVVVLPEPLSRQRRLVPVKDPLLVVHWVSRPSSATGIVHL